MACMCMYWPDITDAIKDSVSACKPCLTFSSKQQCEPYVSDTVSQPWSHLSLENFGVVYFDLGDGEGVLD